MGLGSAGDSNRKCKQSGRAFGLYMQVMLKNVQRGQAYCKGGSSTAQHSRWGMYRVVVVVVVVECSHWMPPANAIREWSKGCTWNGRESACVMCKCELKKRVGAL